MTKKEFKIRWEKDDLGDGLNWEDIVNCYIKWRLGSNPRIKPLPLVRYRVLKAANTIDAKNYKPQEK